MKVRNRLQGVCKELAAGPLPSREEVLRMFQLELEPEEEDPENPLEEGEEVFVFGYCIGWMRVCMLQPDEHGYRCSSHLFEGTPVFSRHLIRRQLPQDTRIITTENQMNAVSALINETYRDLPDGTWELAEQDLIRKALGLLSASPVESAEQ